MQKLMRMIAKSSVIKFVLVGGASTGIDFLLYMVLSGFLPVAVAKAVSMIAASAFSFVANKRFSFQNREKTTFRSLFRFYLVFAANLAVNVGVNSLVYRGTQRKILAFVIATACGMVVNYCGQRFFVFRKDGEQH